jgi:hypothetical protein
MMEAVTPFETSVSFYQTLRRNIPEDSHHQFSNLCFLGTSCCWQILITSERTGRIRRTWVVAGYEDAVRFKTAALMTATRLWIWWLWMLERHSTENVYCNCNVKLQGAMYVPQKWDCV